MSWPNTTTAPLPALGADAPTRAGPPTGDLLVHREVCRSGTLDEFRAQLNSFFYPARVETHRHTPVLREPPWVR